MAADLHYFYFVSINSIVINSDQIHIRIEGDYHISSFRITLRVIIILAGLGLSQFFSRRDFLRKYI